MSGLYVSNADAGLEIRGLTRLKAGVARDTSWIYAAAGTRFT
jgi:hypothetical protein